MPEIIMLISTQFIEPRYLFKWNLLKLFDHFQKFKYLWLHYKKSSIYPSFVQTRFSLKYFTLDPDILMPPNLAGGLTAVNVT